MVKEGRTLEQTSHWSTSEIFTKEVLLESDKVNENSLVHYWSILHKSIKSSSNWKVFLVRRLHPLSNFEVPWKKTSKGIIFSLN